MVIQTNDRKGSAVIGSLPPAYCLFYRPECIVLTQHDPPQKRVMKKNIFMKNGFQIRIQRPRISKFSEFFDYFKIFTKIEAHILRGRSKAKTACATCQPLVVLKSPNLRRSYSIIRLYHHTKGKVHTISPSCSIKGGYFFKKVPPPLYRRCVWKTYTDEGLKMDDN